MFNLEELEKFVAFAELGTLAKVADNFHISTPTITRTMQNVEKEFGTELFTRKKNSISLNSVGLKAVEAAKNILTDAKKAHDDVQAFAQSLKTITVQFCAPAPLYTLLPKLTALFPEMTIKSSINQNADILVSLQTAQCDLAILPYEPEDTRFITKPYMEEHLGVSVKDEHYLAKYQELTFAEINGFNFLLRSELGFWDALCHEKMPSSRFLVQTNDFEFREIAANSSLPCFATDFGITNGLTPPNRKFIPITDKEAYITFYLVANKDNRFFKNLNKILYFSLT